MVAEITKKDKTSGNVGQAAVTYQDSNATRRMLALALVLDGSDRKTGAERATRWTRPIPRAIRFTATMRRAACRGLSNRRHRAHPAC